jgi:putative mRNA 3-end processing factor
MNLNVEVTHKGAVLLGKQVSVDGFVDNGGFRVQTHVHEDHLRSFFTSLGFQQGIILTKPTLDLIASIKKEPALYHRNNIHIVPGNSTTKVDGIEIEFLDSSHMLGSVQVSVSLSNGIRCGYSGDFSWPLDKVIQVDELVVDSTYGSPESVRKFSQGDIEERLLSLVTEHISNNPIIIKSHRGTIQRAMHTISSNLNIPIIASKRLSREIKIFNEYGYDINNYFTPYSKEGTEILNSKYWIRFYGTGDILPCDTSDLTSINLKAIYGRAIEPVTDHGNNNFTIAYSNHADFNDTINYVYSSNAKKVLTDSSRSGFHNASSLAREIKKRLNIEAYPSQPLKSNLWGE